MGVGLDAVSLVTLQSPPVLQPAQIEPHNGAVIIPRKPSSQTGKRFQLFEKCNCPREMYMVIRTSRQGEATPNTALILRISKIPDGGKTIRTISLFDL